MIALLELWYPLCVCVVVHVCYACVVVCGQRGGCSGVCACMYVTYMCVECACTCMHGSRGAL